MRHMSVSGLKIRSETVNKLRQTLQRLGFTEVEPQYLSEAVPAEPTIYPFVTKNNLFLTTSPEAYLKRAMAAGLGNCFAISHAFRDQEGKNDLHNPEFLLAEWYIKDAGLQEIINSVEEIVAEMLNLEKGFPRLSWLKFWPELPKLIGDKAMINFAKKHGYSTKGATWEQLFYQYADNEIRKKFPSGQFFLTDFPTRISRLAKPQSEDPDFCERFELLINGIEIADGNVEYFDEKAIRSILSREAKKRKAPTDEKFLAAIRALEGQKWAGVGLGVDRLAMIAGHIKSIHELLEP